MKKRILSMLLAFQMLFSAVAVPGYAAEENEAGENISKNTQELCDVCNSEPCVCVKNCEVCGEDPCVCEDTCEICGEDPCVCVKNCEVCGEDPCVCEKTCEICGEDPCVCVKNCEVCGEDPCVCVKTCEICNEDPCVCESVIPYVGLDYDYSGSVGMLAEFDASYLAEDYIFDLYVGDKEELHPTYAAPFYPSEFEDAVFVIEDWIVLEDVYEDFYENGEIIQLAQVSLWYQLSLKQGTAPDGYVDGCWVMQNYLGEEAFEEDLLYLYAPEVEPEPEPEVACPICGVLGCETVHEGCLACGAVNCTEDHIYCYGCGNYDCGETHVWCSYCKRFGCELDHVSTYKPVTYPVIADSPSLGGGMTVVDADGNNVNGGIVLPEGRQISLSAWSSLGDSAGYQWQICYDIANDLWANIQGQTGKGILVSPAMLRGVLDLQGAAYLRVVAGSGDTKEIGPAIPVVISASASGSSEFIGDPAVPLASGDDLETVYVVVQYQYADGRTAAATDFAQLIPGDPYSHDYSVPVIPGYMATLKNASAHGDSAVLSADRKTLHVKFAEGALSAAYTTMVIEYVPDYVNYTVIHYWQNTYNDNYEVHEWQTIENTHKTGEIIADAHKSYPGFFNLLYETPAAAADGSTVIEVYYDRYYYLMKFELGTNGYGTDPVYARFGDDLEVETPTRAGYTFMGWTLNGEDVEAPTYMPAENRTYVAKWQEDETAKVSVVFWGEEPDCPDDNKSYKYVTTKEVYVKPGTEYTFTAGTNLVCGYTHEHTDSCFQLICDKAHDHEESGCALGCDHRNGHALDCYKVSWGSLETTKKPSNIGNANNDGIYTYKSGNRTYYYLKIGNTWYRSSYGATNSIEPNCSHIHEDVCYTCGKTAHRHNDGCYKKICGESHVHSDACYDKLPGLDSKLWNFVSSETVTVNADGTSNVNVYYDRVKFTIDFYNSETIKESNKVYTINAKWGADISAHWPIPGHADGDRWKPNNSKTYTQVLVFIAIMPQESFYLTVSEVNYDTFRMHYMVEALPGQSGQSFTSNKVTKTFNESFMVEANYNHITKAEDFFALEGYDTWASNPAFDSNGKIDIDGGGDVYFYYTRHKYAIEFYSPTVLLKTTENVPYESPLAAYDYTPDASDAPKIYEPGSVAFAGWYLNPECTGDQYILSEHTMPVGTENGDTTLVLYAAWEPVTYTVRYYMDSDMMEARKTIPDQMAELAGTDGPSADSYAEVFKDAQITHGNKITGLQEPGVAEGFENIHPYKGYEFEGWFYIDEDGEEAAFDPENMPVNQNLNLYAKWRGNKICAYNVYFALDKDENGVADVDSSGNIIYVAPPISSSGVAGLSYTFDAKGGEELYAQYRQGFFPNVVSHTIKIDIADENGTGTNSFIFLYREREAVPYTVKYLEEGSGKIVAPEKVVSDNRNVVVTENFVYAQGYMPDAYQKSLVVSHNGVNEIIFWYTQDVTHALYVVNHYIEDLDSQLNYKGWSEYRSLQSTGDIGTEYSAEATNISGYTLSAVCTNLYNTVEKINAARDTKLPADVSPLNDGSISGELQSEGLELNFYYTRNLYPYEFRYMLVGTSTQLADPEFGIAAFDSTVTGAAKEIVMDIDDDGINEDYRLYDPTETSKSITIKADGEALDRDEAVEAGDATVNIATFYYVRCTQDMHISKQVQENAQFSNPDAEQEFDFSLLINAKNGYHRNSYDYEIWTLDAYDNKVTVSTGTLSPVLSAPNTLQFSLKDGETISILGLPTAEYNLTELNIPHGYTAELPEGRQKLTVDNELHLDAINRYDPARLVVSKTVSVVEYGNTQEVEDFEITIDFPDNAAAESYSYIQANESRVAKLENGSITLSLKNGETAVFENLPQGEYTLTETDYSAQGYKSNVSLNGAEYVESRSVTAQLAYGTTQIVDYLNRFPVGDLDISKTVTKAFAGSPWKGDSFSFTVRRISEGRPLYSGNSYALSLDGKPVTNQDGSQYRAYVNDMGELVVTIDFSEEWAEGAKSLNHVLTVKNLPVGSYTVTEEANPAYNQLPTGLVVSGLEIPSATVPVAKFENELIRTNGDLKLKKLLIPEENYTGELPSGQRFNFTVELLEQPPEEDTQFQIVYDSAFVDENGDPTGESLYQTVTMVNGSFSIDVQKDQTVTFKDLPIGKYRITETVLNGYACSFSHIVDGQEEEQPVQTENGNVYTEIVVDEDDSAFVQCTNVYPVTTGELVLKKLVSKEYERDTLPDEEFTLSVSLGERNEGSEDMILCTVYNADGSVAVAEHKPDVISGSFSVELKNGQYALYKNMPVCDYTVSETDSEHYIESYELFVSAKNTAPADDAEANSQGSTVTASGTVSANNRDTVVFTNEYIKHLGQLTISKSVDGMYSDNDSFIFHISGNGVEMDVSINGSGSVTVYDLPLGSYTVTEDTSWSWRYEAANPVMSTTLNLEKLEDTLAFSNSYVKNNWLSYVTHVENIFVKGGNQ